LRAWKAYAITFLIHQQVNPLPTMIFSRPNDLIYNTIPIYKKERIIKNFKLYNAYRSNIK